MLKGYDEQKKLDYRSQARDKLPVWYGSRENYQHPAKEILANGIDEITGNFDSGHMELELSDDCKRISVRDSGRGMPLLEKMADGTPYYEGFFEILFSGTKYDGINDTENSTSVGTNGVGLATCCLTSVYFQAEVQYGDDEIQKHVRITYLDGGLNREIEELPYDDRVGTFTKITYELDPEVYTNVIYDPEEVKDIVKHVSIPSNSVTLTMVFKDDISVFETSDFGGYFYDLVGNQTTSAVFSSPMRDYESDELNKIQLLFTTMPNIYQESYLNGSYLSNKGSIHDGVMDGVRKFGNKYCADNKLFPKSITKLTKEDIESSVSYLVKMLSTKADFVGQTKMRTEKTLYKKIASEQTGLMLEVAKNENPKALEKFFKHVIEVSKANVVVAKAQKKLKKQLSENVTGINNRVDKLKDCRKHDEDSEIHFAEGDSAGGSLVKARDADYQAIYPLRGKFLNVMKATETEAINNPVLMDIIKIIGTGIQSNNKAYNTFDINNSKYGKIFVDCFTGDTTVKMADGTLKTFEELASMNDNPDKVFPVYSIDKNGNPTIGNAKNPRMVKKVNTLYKITLDDGQEFKSTADHFYMDRQGNYVMTKDLYVGQSMMPLYTKIGTDCFGKDREFTKNNRTGEYILTHWMSYDTFNTDRHDDKGNVIKGVNIHHRDDNKNNNDPTNLILLPTDVHRRISDYRSTNRMKENWANGKMESSLTWSETYNGTQAQKDMLSRKRAEGAYDNTSYFINYNKSDAHSKDVKQAWKDGKYTQAVNNIINYNHSQAHKDVTAKTNSNPKIILSIRRNRVLQTIKFLLLNNLELNEENWNTFKKINTVPYKDILTSFEDFEEMIKYVEANLKSIEMKDYRSQWEQKKAKDDGVNRNHEDYEYNHKIAKIEKMELEEPVGVYCMSVDEHHNFAISQDNRSGIIVKNCDADSDGSHIQALFITFMFKYMRPLIEAGRLYMLVTPLYIVHTDDGEIIYYNSDREKDLNYPKLKGKPTVSRLKGLGEMDAGTLESIAMNKDTRTAVQVTVEDAEKLSELITTWMAKDVGDRRDIITDSLSDYIDLI